MCVKRILYISYCPSPTTARVPVILLKLFLLTSENLHWRVPGRLSLYSSHHPVIHPHPCFIPHRRKRFKNGILQSSPANPTLCLRSDGNPQSTRILRCVSFRQCWSGWCLCFLLRWQPQGNDGSIRWDTMLQHVTSILYFYPPHSPWVSSQPCVMAWLTVSVKLCSAWIWVSLFFHSVQDNKFVTCVLSCVSW